MMKLKRFLLSWAALLATALVWNGLLHGVVLKATDASVRHLWRPDLDEKTWLGVLMTVALAALFVLGWARFARTGSMGEGLAYGLFFALVAGLLVDLNQYVLFPLPASVVARWFLGGLVEFSLDGLIVSRLYPATG